MPANTAISELATSFAGTVRAIRPDQLDARTPCKEFTVAELLGHLAPVLASSERAARKQPQTSGSSNADAASIDPAAVADLALGVGTAWAEPAAWEGTTEFGEGEMPAQFAGTITLQELALHGWDLAHATGSTFSTGEETAKATLAAVEQLAGGARTDGTYGPVVTLAPGASTFDRALAESGRDPQWAAV